MNIQERNYELQSIVALLCLFTMHTSEAGYACNPGDTMLAGNMCRPALLTSAATNTYGCPAAIGDPIGASWFIQSGTAQTTTLSQPSTATSPTCLYNPPTIDGVYSYSTFSCSTPNTLSGTQCLPAAQVMTPAQTTGYSCPAPDVLGGNTCTPPIAIIPAGLNTTYSCNSITDYLSTITHQCIPLLQTATATANSAFACGQNAVLNTATNMCNKLNLPATAVDGVWKCPADYTLSGSQCLPNQISTYPAAWYLGTYVCTNGGSLGAIPGLCYK